MKCASTDIDPNVDRWCMVYSNSPFACKRRLQRIRSSICIDSSTELCRWIASRIKQGDFFNRKDVNASYSSKFFSVSWGHTFYVFYDLAYNWLTASQPPKERKCHMAHHSEVKWLDGGRKEYMVVVKGNSREGPAGRVQQFKSLYWLVLYEPILSIVD